jgi:hypothetical protein
MLAAVPLKNPGGDRSVSNLACERVYATPNAGICLSADRGAITTYGAQLLDGRLTPVRDLPMGGVPSRTRLSPDSSWTATTSFLSGHGYGSIGFSTETVITDRATGRSLGNLEKTFATLINGERVKARDLNVWGVTFPAGPHPATFYATVATGGETWLARGDLRSRTLTALRKNAECPSLSPDGRRLVYKKRAGAPTRWRYHVLDLETGLERALPERRSVDDQAEWLDDHRVLYGLQREGTGQTDVWMVDVRRRTQPRVLVPDAWSPAVVDPR